MIAIGVLGLILILSLGYFVAARGVWVPRSVAKTFARKSLPQFVVTPGCETSGEDYDRRWDIKNFLHADGTGPFEGKWRGTARNFYDVDGRFLFCDFTAKLRNKLELRVRTAGNAVLNDPVISIGVNEPLPIDDWMKKSRAVAKENNLTPIRGNKATVCYAYPLLGLLCRDAHGKRWVVRLDTQVPHEVDGLVGSSKAAKKRPVTLGGHTVWSPLDARRSSPAHKRLQHRAMSVFRYGFNALTLERLPKLRTSASPAPRKILDVDLIAQSEGNFCGPATAKMILNFDFKHLVPPKTFNMSQAKIAEAMNAPKNHVDGVGLVDFRNAFETITENLFKASPDTSPTFQEARAEIDAGRPLVNRVEHHIRATIGWSGQDEKTGALGDYIYIHDPSPKNLGFKDFQKWGAPDRDRITNHYYIKRTS